MSDGTERKPTRQLSMTERAVSIALFSIAAAFLIRPVYDGIDIATHYPGKAESLFFFVFWLPLHAIPAAIFAVAGWAVRH